MSLGLDGLDQFENPSYFIARVLDGRLASNLGAFRQAMNGQQNNLEEEVRKLLHLHWNGILPDLKLGTRALKALL